MSLGSPVFITRVVRHVWCWPACNCVDGGAEHGGVEHVDHGGGAGGAGVLGITLQAKKPEDVSLGCKFPHDFGKQPAEK